MTSREIRETNRNYMGRSLHAFKPKEAECIGQRLLGQPN